MSDVQRSLFGDGRAPAHGATAPTTSVIAARDDRSGTEGRILAAFAAFGALTDDELCERLADLYPPTVKTARSRLTNRHRLADTGVTRLSRRNRPQIVWHLATYADQLRGRPA